MSSRFYRGAGFCARPVRCRGVIALTDAMIGVGVVGLTVGLLWQGLEAGSERARENRLIEAVTRTGRAMVEAIAQAGGDPVHRGPSGSQTIDAKWKAVVRADPGLADLAPGGWLGTFRLMPCYGGGLGNGPSVFAGLYVPYDARSVFPVLSKAADRLAEARRGGLIGQVDGKRVKGPGWSVPLDNARADCGMKPDTRLFPPGSPVFIAQLPYEWSDTRFLQRQRGLYSKDFYGQYEGADRSKLRQMQRPLDMGGHDIINAGTVFADQGALAQRLEVTGPTHSGLLVADKGSSALLDGPLAALAPVDAYGSVRFVGGLNVQERFEVLGREGLLSVGTAAIEGGFHVSTVLSVGNAIWAKTIEDTGSLSSGQLRAAVVKGGSMSSGSLYANRIRVRNAVTADRADIDELVTGSLQ